MCVCIALYLVHTEVPDCTSLTPSNLQIAPFNGNTDDLGRFVYEVISSLNPIKDKVTKDMTKLRLMARVLEGSARE